MSMPINKLNALGSFSKRAFDISFAIFLLCCVAPMMLMASAAIKIEGRGPIFYRQMRCGRYGRPFGLLLFRSMKVDGEELGVAGASGRDPRITNVGAFLRATNIDQLPTLINVIRGEVSFVGPRPERLSFANATSEFIPDYNERFRVKPGLVGLSQIYHPYGNSPKDIKEKHDLDMKYINSQSMLIDLWILIRGVVFILFPKVIFGFSNFGESLRRTKYAITTIAQKIAFRRLTASIYESAR